MNFSVNLHEKPVGNWRTGIALSLELPINLYSHSPKMQGLRLITHCTNQCTGNNDCLKMKRSSKLPMLTMPRLYMYQRMDNPKSYGERICTEKEKYGYIDLVVPGYLTNDIVIEETFYVDSKDIVTATEQLKKVPGILTEQLSDGLEQPATPAKMVVVWRLGTEELTELGPEIKSKPRRRLIASNVT